MFHLTGYYVSRDGAAVLSAIPAIQDQAIFTSGNDIRVPNELPFIIGEILLSNSTTVTSAQVQSPSLRTIANIDVAPLVNAVKLAQFTPGVLHPRNPIPLQGDEAINFLADTDAAGAFPHYGMIWFADGVQSEVTGEIYTVTGTGDATLAAGSWVNTNITFNQSLPVGNYQIVGFRADSTNLVAARIVFIGGAWRPGVLAGSTALNVDQEFTRYGRLGSYGEFHTNTPPTIDCLGQTDTAQTFTFDLIKVS